MQHALEKIIQICEDNNIVLIGVKFYCTREYAEFIENNFLVATDHLNKKGANELISKMFVNYK